MAYLLYNSSGRIFKKSDGIFCGHGALDHLFRPRIPLLALAPASTRCYSVFEQEAGGGSVLCVQGGVPVLVESRIGPLSSEEPSTSPSGCLSGRKLKKYTFLFRF